MTTIGNSVFYCFHKNNNVKDIVQSLHPYVFTKDEPQSIVNIDKNYKQYPSAVQPTTYSPETDYFIPAQKDGLFWCLYVAMYSYGEYSAIHRNYGLKKMELNQEILDFLVDNNHLMKQVNHKFSKVAITELLADLSINQQSTTFVNVYAYLCFYKFNVYIINNEKKSYLPFIFDAELPSFFIYVDGFKQYKLRLEPASSSDIEHLDNNFVCLEGMKKTMKSLSAYKIADLTTIMEKLHLPSSKLKKNELYTTILETIHW